VWWSPAWPFAIVRAGGMPADDDMAACSIVATTAATNPLAAWVE